MQYKIGDFVIHKKHGVGEIIDIDETKRMYVVKFHLKGVHKVKFSTELKKREHGDYIINYHKRQDYIRIRFYCNDSNIDSEEFLFSEDVFYSLCAKNNVIEREGLRFLLKKRAFSTFNVRELSITTEKIMNVYEMYCVVKFSYFEESLCEILELNGVETVFEDLNPVDVSWGSKSKSHYIACIEEKYGVKLDFE